METPAAWEDPERAAKLLARLPGDAGLPPDAVDELERLCAASPDPEGALAGAARALQARRESLGPARRSALGPLVTVCAGSRFLAQHLAARPRLVDLLAARGFATCARANDRLDALARRLVRGLDPGDQKAPARLALRLRRNKQAEALRIALRDLGGFAPIDEVARELSLLAAVSFEAALRLHYRRLCAAHGAPDGRSADGPSGFCVLGMGKLGGDELNFSSDVDVVYVYDKDGRTQGGPAGAIDHFAFYAKLAEEATRAVGASQESGFVFRVDLDLRPEGRSGPIVNALRGLEIYYETQGAAWERFALLRARPVAGELAVGEEGLRRLAPFIWRKYLDLTAVEEMRTLKGRAEREAARRGGVDLKLGPGGIREVEFFVQALQLLHGGKDKHLRERHTLRALDRLVYAGLLSGRDRDELVDAWRLLRALEHRVQMVAERQTHLLPESAAELALLARRAGFPGAEALQRELAGHRARVEARFKDLLRVAGGEPDAVDPRAATVADPLAADPERREALVSLGFASPDACLAELERLRRRRGTPFSPSAPAELQQSAQVLVAELAKAPDPDQALRHLTDLFGAVVEPQATARLLAQSPRTARLLLTLFGSSDYLSRSLLRRPELIEQLVMRGSAPLVRTFDDQALLLGDRLSRAAPDDVEARIPELGRFRSEEVLRIGLHDVAGALEPQEVGAQLADLADLCVLHCLPLAERDARRRDGTPRLEDGGEARLVVVGLGKLGGRELGYHSDLDLLFLYSGPGETDGARRVTNHEHFARVAQKLISLLTLPLREGPLYKIDTRLRPSGSAGPLVVSFDALARYHGDDARAARLWERQALLRARGVAGDLALFERAREQVLAPSLFRRLDGAGRAEAARELWTMRERMEREIAGESTERYNCKTGRGGLVDVEFAVQFLQLAHGRDRPEVRVTSTPAALAALARAGLLAPADFEPLLDGWRFLRRLEARLRIVRERSVDHIPRGGRDLVLLARRMGLAGSGADQGLLALYERTTRAVRAAFRRVLGVPGGEGPA